MKKDDSELKERLCSFAKEWVDIECELRKRAVDILDRYGWILRRKVFGVTFCERVSINLKNDTFYMIDTQDPYTNDFEMSYSLPMDILFDDKALEAFVAKRNTELDWEDNDDEQAESELYEYLCKKYGKRNGSEDKQ